MIRSPRFPLAAAFVVYVLFRVWIVATNFDAVAIPVYEVPGMGNHAWSLVHGREGVPWHYFYDNAGGQLLTGYLAAPLYALFGASYAVLKLVPFLLGVGLLGLVWRFLRRNVGYTAAVVGVFAFALAPPTLSKYSVLAKGNHFEGLFFLFLPVVLYFEAQARRSLPLAAEEHPSRDTAGRWLFAAGLAAGTAVSVYFGSLLTLALLALAALLFGPRQGVRDLRFVLPGAALGLIPFLATHLATGGRALDYAERFTQPDPKKSAEGMFAEARSLLLDTLPEGACFEPLGVLPASIGEWLLLAAIGVSWIATVAAALRPRRTRPARRAAAMICALYLPLVLGVIAVGVLSILPKMAPVEILGVRYLVSFYFYALLVIAIGVDSLLAGPRARRAVGFGVALALASTWLFVLPIGTTRFDRASDGLRYPGTFFRNYGSLFHRDAVKDPVTGLFSLDLDHIRRVANAFDGVEREDLLFSVGNSLAYTHLAPTLDPATGKPRVASLDVRAIVEAHPAEDRPWIARGIGAHLRTRVPQGAPPPQIVRRWIGEALSDVASRQSVAEGLGMSLEYPLRRNWPNELARTRVVLEFVPEELREAFRRGQARDLAVRARIGVAGSQESIASIVESIPRPNEREALEATLESLAGSN